ncbi:hypothetical protein C8R45DRAFT_1006015 [Mycena sanguinolenta]|nr:hypothetical protein C8R45DRAFT_1006015 [Mycena sanguinolenta]
MAAVLELAFRLHCALLPSSFVCSSRGFLLFLLPLLRSALATFFESHPLVFTLFNCSFFVRTTRSIDSALHRRRRTRT